MCYMLRWDLIEEMRKRNQVSIPSVAASTCGNDSDERQPATYRLVELGDRPTWSTQNYTE